MQVLIESLGVLGPGLPNWACAKDALRQPAAWQWTEAAIPAPAGLPGAERRRVSQAVKVAMAVAQQACENSQFEPGELPSVFSSSGGDGQNCHLLCEALAEDDPSISPTRFTNSVHNAPSGYWSIATGCRLSANSLCGFDGSFATGLLEAALLVHSEQTPVLLVAYDVCYPAPLSALRPISTPFGVAMVLAPATFDATSSALGSLHIEYGLSEPESTLTPVSLDSLRTGVPSARSLPLLAMIANELADTVVLPAPGNQKVRLVYHPSNPASQ